MGRTEIRRLTTDAVLTGVALIIFIIELQLPSLSPVPGLKLGLSNIVTVYAMFALTPADALAILAARILLGCFFSGNLSALMYSAAGGLMCGAAMGALRKFLTQKQIWVASVVGALMHNLGQVTVAALITRTPGLMYYVPVLAAAGMLAGLFTGLCAQFLLGRLRGRASGC